MANLDLIPMDNPVPGMIDAAAERYGVDRNLAHVVAQMESNYNPRAVSKAGAQGVMQLMPATARDLGVSDPFDPAQNIEGGVKYLAQLSSRYNGDPRLTLAAYNAGPGAVDRAGGVPPYAETQNYVALGTKRLDSAAQSAPLDLIPMEPTPSSAPAQTSVEIRPPLTEPPGGTPAPPEEKSVKGFLDNLTTSAYNNLVSPIVHPGQTLAGISNLLEGMGEMTGNKPVPGMQGRQAIEGLTNLYTTRYGSWQGFKDAWYKDPVGMLGDLAIAADGLGLGKAATQDFIRASGLTDAATAARDTLAGVVPTTGKVGAATTAGVKAVPGAATAAFKKAFDPALILSGPHSMVIGAKLEFAKQVAKAAKDAWKGATPEVAEAAAEGAIRLTPEEQAFWQQRSSVVPAAPVPLPPERGLPAPVTPIVTPVTDTSGVTAVPAQYPEVQPGFTRPPETPSTTTTPWTGPTGEPLTPGQILAQSEGRDWASLRPQDRAMMEAIAQGRANAAAQQPVPPATVQPPPPPVTLTPQELTELSTGRPPSRQSDAAQQASAETLATARAAEAPTPPVTPEPPAAPATTTPPAEAPAGPLADPVAWTREQLAAGNKVSTGMLQRRFGMKYSAADKLLKNLAPPETSAEGKAAFEQAKASGQPAVTFPGSPGEPAAVTEPVVQPGQTVAEALAAHAPQGVPPSLAELMAGIGEAPAPKPLDFAEVTRSRNVEHLYNFMKEHGITPEMVDAEGDAAWSALAKKAKIGPKNKPSYVPSETTRAQLRQRFEKVR